jgi:hypothetical protein
MSLNAPLWRDSNQSPVQIGGVVSRKSQTLAGSNTTVATPIFRITGSIQVVSLYGVVTTDFGANNTAAYYRLNDQTAQPAITLATGTTLSAIKAGSVIVKKGLAAAAVTLLDNSAGRVSEPTTLETAYFSPFAAVKKTGANTDIEFVYSTTDTPTSGVIQHFIVWLPISQDASVVAQ